MSNNVLGYPRKLLSEEDKIIRLVRKLLAEGELVASVVEDGDYGDIEVTNTGSTWTVESWGGRKVVSSVAELEAAVSGAVAGDVIFIAAGDYALTSGSTLIIAARDVTLCGAGREATRLRQPDFDTDIISIRESRIVVENMLIYHGTTYGAGAGSAGYGRGIVIEAPLSVTSHVADVQIRNVSIFNCANWCIYDTAVRVYDVKASPPGGAESPCYGFDFAAGTTHGPFNCNISTVSKNVSAVTPGDFANVRVGRIVTGTSIPHNTRVVAKADNSNITISRYPAATGTSNLSFSHNTQCGESVEVLVSNVICAFANSGGCIYVGAGSTTWRISNLRTNSYSYGSYTDQINFGSVTTSLTMGQVHFYGATGHLLDGCILQSPSDDTIHDDKDATMVSVHQTNKVNINDLYVEVLSTNLADGNGVGVPGRGHWLFTSMNCLGLSVHEPIIVSQVTNAGIADEGFPLRIWKTCVDDPNGTELLWRGGQALHRRLYYNGTTRVASPPYETGDTVAASLDTDDFVFGAGGDADDKRPITIEDFDVINYVGLRIRPPSVGSGSINTRTHFRLSNSRLQSIGIFDDADASGMTTSTDDFRARTSIHRALRPGIYGHTRGLGRAFIRAQWTALNQITCVTAGDFAAIVVGCRVEGNLVPANTYITAKAGDVITLSAGPVPPPGAYPDPATVGYTFTFYAPGTYQREGLWGVSALGNDVRQIPWERKHTSAWADVYAGDKWMELGGTLNLSVYPRAYFHWYDNGGWLSVVGIPRNTTATGDTIYYSAANTPARLAIGNTADMLTVVGGVPVWKAPVVDSDGNIVTSGGEIVFT